MRAELSPACEAVLPRHGELSVGQPGGGVRVLEVAEPVLGELLQVLETGTIRQGHGAPSFLVPGVRGVGRKVVMSIRSAGGFNPSRGPSAAWTALFASLLRHGAKSRPGEEDTCFLVLWAPLSFTTRVTGGSGVGGWRRGLLQRQRRSGTPSSRPPLEERRFGRAGDGADGAEDPRRQDPPAPLPPPPRLAFDAAGAPSLDQVALHGDEEGDGGDGDDYARRHDHAPVHDGGVEEVVDAHGQRLELLRGDEHEGEEEIVPGEDEGEDARGDDAG